MKDARTLAKELRVAMMPKVLQEQMDRIKIYDGLYDHFEGTKASLIFDHRLEWVSKLRDLYLETVYKEYFMEDGPLEEKQEAIYIFDTEFSRMLDMLVIALYDNGYTVDYKAPPQLTAPVSSAISVLGLMALDCKVSDPYILGSILER